MTSSRPLPREWHVQYRTGLGDHIALHLSPENAIEDACRLLDHGHEVFAIGRGLLTDSIGEQDIARIYALWAAASGPRIAKALV